MVDEAYAGDIIGVFDPGIFSIGDTLTLQKNLHLRAFLHLHRSILQESRQLDTMKRKQFVKGINQIAQEGAIQIFQEFYGMEEIILSVLLVCCSLMF